MKNASNSMNRKSVLALAGTLSMVVAGSVNGQAAANDIQSFVGGYSSPAQKIQTVSGTVQTNNRTSDIGQKAMHQFGETLGVESCGSETLTQSTNETFINSSSVWCGTLDHNAETSLARSFVAAADLTLKCVTFGIRENIGGAANVNVRVLVGSPTSAYADLTLVSETVVAVADNTAFALFTSEIGDVQIPAGSQYIVELNTPTRVPGLGGDGGLLSFGTNTLGQSGTTYMRASECSVNDFVDVASVGFGDRHLVMSLGYDNGIAPTIQGGFPMSAIGDAVMSQLGDDIVIAGDPNGAGFGVAIDYGTASSGVGATITGLIAGDDVAGATLSMNFVGEEQVASIQFSDYLGDPTVAVIDVDFANSELDLFDVYVYNGGELVGILEDQLSGDVRIRNIGNDIGPWIETICGIEVSYPWRCRPGSIISEDCTFRQLMSYSMPYCDDWEIATDFEVLVGDEFEWVPIDTLGEEVLTLDISVEGVSGFTVDVAGNSPSIAIGDAFSAPYYDEFGELLTAQVGVSFSLYGTDSDAILTGEDVDGDGLADLVVDSSSGSFAVDMTLGGVESASIAFDTMSGIWPPYPIEFCPFGPPINDGPGSCSDGLGINHPGGCTNPFGKLVIDSWGTDQWSVNPDFTGMTYDTVAYEFLLNGEPVGPAIGGEGIMGGTSEMATRAGVFSGDDYGFEAYYPAGTTFTTNEGIVFEVDEIQMIAVGAIGPDSLSFMRIGADIVDEDATDVQVSLSLPETTFTDFNLCPADLNGDGVLNFFDVSAFLQGFANQDPASDFNGDGVWDFFDVSAFLQAFAAGCP